MGYDKPKGNSKYDGDAKKKSDYGDDKKKGSPDLAEFDFNLADLEMDAWTQAEDTESNLTLF